MNLLLIESDELDEHGRVTLGDRRAEHLARVLKVDVDTRLRAGLIGGGRGSAVVEDLDISKSSGPGSKKKTVAVTLRVEIDSQAPPRPELDLVIGLPRPAVLHRVLQHAAAIGVGRLDLINAWRVEKSFFQSPALKPAAIRRHLLLGLEQGQQTWLPEVHIHHRLVPFVEALPTSAADECRLIAHPGADAAIEDALDGSAQRFLLAIGPEGGWIDRELETFAAAGFTAAALGPWILRSEAAVTAAVAQIAVLRRLEQRRRTSRVTNQRKDGVRSAHR